MKHKNMKNIANGIAANNTLNPSASENFIFSPLKIWDSKNQYYDLYINNR